MNEAIVGAIWPTAVANFKALKCTLCGEEITAFRDSISRKEYHISGMCQDCQDDVFGAEGSEAAGKGEDEDACAA